MLFSALLVLGAGGVADSLSGGESVGGSTGGVGEDSSIFSTCDFFVFK